MKKVLSPNSALTLKLADLCRVLPDPFLRPLFWFIGRLLYMFHGGRRREAIAAFERLREVLRLPDSGDELARRYFRMQFVEIAGEYILDNERPSRWQNFVEIEGMPDVKKALDEGHGLVVCTMHFGADLVTFGALGRLGYPIACLRPVSMKDIESPKARRMLYIHNDVVYVGDSPGLASPIRSATKKLSENYVIGVALDGDQGGSELNVPFLGRELELRIGGLEAARIGRAPMVFALCAVENDRFKLHFSRVWRFGQKGTESETIGEFLHACMQEFEVFLRRYPECVWWTRPFSQALGVRTARK